MKYSQPKIVADVIVYSFIEFWGISGGIFLELLDGKCFYSTITSPVWLLFFLKTYPGTCWDLCHVVGVKQSRKILTTKGLQKDMATWHETRHEKCEAFDQFKFHNSRASKSHVTSQKIFSGPPPIG